ncbi:DUF1616 domain-containing protein [Methanogenium organophilum]|uniref:DUF1616 domain-containing protein n=1 Tax=Methanogenium organophilum TaxID=2199 RepID=A0A9X9S4D9_METOG|nr:DUF1616 domain-containing protein [Methanogenium organophilum]WAI00695.1 DUF1616 domain-containing protein [Methanogenium organophilum]
MTKSPTTEDLYRAFGTGIWFRDLVGILVWLGIAVLTVYVPYLNESPLRIVFALPVVLFIPGYALIAALFPGNEEIDTLERIALSFGLSIALVPLIGLALNYTPWGIRLDPIVISLVIFTVLMVLAAHYRRALLAPEERFSMPIWDWYTEAKSELFSEDQSSLDRALSYILIIAIVAAVVTTIYVIVVPKEGEHFTEFYILGEEGMAADYPDRFSVGTAQPVIIGVGNHEYKPVDYMIEVWEMNQEWIAEENRSEIYSMDLLDRFPVSVAHNETTEIPYNFTVTDGGTNRIQFLLFMDAVPDDSVSGAERINASYQDLHLWVDVRPSYG